MSSGGRKVTERQRPQPSVPAALVLLGLETLESPGCSFWTQRTLRASLQPSPPWLRDMGHTRRLCCLAFLPIFGCSPISGDKRSLAWTFRGVQSQGAGNRSCFKAKAQGSRPQWMGRKRRPGRGTQRERVSEEQCIRSIRGKRRQTQQTRGREASLKGSEPRPAVGARTVPIRKPGQSSSHAQKRRHGAGSGHFPPPVKAPKDSAQPSVLLGLLQSKD